MNERTKGFNEQNDIHQNTIKAYKFEKFEQLETKKVSKYGKNKQNKNLLQNLKIGRDLFVLCFWWYWLYYSILRNDNLFKNGVNQTTNSQVLKEFDNRSDLSLSFRTFDTPNLIFDNIGSYLSTLAFIFITIAYRPIKLFSTYLLILSTVIIGFVLIMCNFFEFSTINFVQMVQKKLIVNFQKVFNQFRKYLFLKKKYNYLGFDDRDQAKNLNYQCPICLKGSMSSDKKIQQKQHKIEDLKEVQLDQAKKTIIQSNQNLVMLNCKHIFHQNCIDKWLQDHNSCPLCRQKLY